MAVLEEKIQNRSALIAVAGLGYVGLPLAVAFAGAGFRVIGLDVQERKVNAVNRGESYIEDISSEELKKIVSSGKLTASADFSLLGEADCVTICVPTPIDEHKTPVISYLSAVSEKIAQYMKHVQLVVLESTTYPGTTEEITLPMLEKSGKKVGKDFYLAFSPERIDPGNKEFNFRVVPRVVGGITQRCTEIASQLYRTIVPSVHKVSSPRVAEMEKLLENIFRIVNISMINEIALLCDRMDIDIWEVIEAAKTKPYGFMPFYPGPGLGGHCIPVDPFYLSWKAKEYGFYTRFIDLAGEINNMMPHFVVTKVDFALNKVKKSLNGSHILALGAAYKESPAIDVIRILLKKHAKVTVFDPHVSRVSIDGAEYPCIDQPDAKTLKKADAVLILTNHAAFDYKLIAENADIIVDTRNAMKGIRKRKVFKL
ncbi:MAG: nucleotide sugar dehydrogenase [Chloroflexi bacterium]|nr:nucleotide sugar dehydrogenase [Chloroflexota bacterium]